MREQDSYLNYPWHELTSISRAELAFRRRAACIFEAFGFPTLESLGTFLGVPVRKGNLYFRQHREVAPSEVEQQKEGFSFSLYSPGGDREATLTLDLSTAKVVLEKVLGVENGARSKPTRGGPTHGGPTHGGPTQPRDREEYAAGGLGRITLSEEERGALAYLACRLLGVHASQGWYLGFHSREESNVGNRHLAAQISIGDMQGSVCIEFSALERFRGPPAISWQRTWLQNRWLRNIPVVLAGEVGSARATLREIHALSPGDFVFLESCWELPGEAKEGAASRALVLRIVPGDGFAWTVVAEGENLRFVSCNRPSSRGTRGRLATESRATPQGRRGEMKTSRTPVQENATEKSEQREAPSIDPEGIPLELRVEVARFSLSLADLAAVRPGEVLLTGAPLGDRVAIRVGDDLIGTGQLVQVDGELGVRIETVDR